MLNICSAGFSRLLKRCMCRQAVASFCSDSAGDIKENPLSNTTSFTGKCNITDSTQVDDNHVTVVEVGPRDGLQNECCIIETGVKVALIDQLSACGLSCIEAASFVSPRWVPQMADAAGVMAAISRLPGVRYPVLVPNMHGLRAAMETAVEEVAVFTAASDTFCRRNTNCSLADSLQLVEQVVQTAVTAGLRVRGYVSCICGCPYEGEISADSVASVASALYRMGCYEISLGDTIGVGTPGHVRRVLKHVLAAHVPASALAIHCHNTYGQALANILTALDMGVRVVDASVAGLGGCPYAPGASGNVATEDVVYMLHGMKLRTGVDLEKLVETGQFICDHLGRDNMSRVAVALSAKKRKCETQV